MAHIASYLNWASVSALQLVVDSGLSASLDAGHVVSHRVEAGLGWVDLDDLFQLFLASCELVFPVSAVRLAFL